MTETVSTTDQGSFYSYHSTRDLSAFVKEIDGRMFNNQSELYMLPSDDTEFQRLDKQHYAFVLALGGLYPCPEVVQDILDPTKATGQLSILDLGCGSGIWAIEMAREFPHCEVIGVDLAPAPVDLEHVPSNCRFEIDDINLGLGHYHEHFDVIHARCIGSGISNFSTMMQDVEACLKPGGIVFFIDGDQRFYEENAVGPVSIGVDPEEGGDPTRGSWLYRIAREVRFAAMYMGADVRGLENCIDEGDMWDHPLIDPATIRVASVFTPMGPWAKSHDVEQSQRLAYAGSLIRQDFMRVHRAWHAILKKAGVPQEKLVQWSAWADEELEQLRFRMYARWRFHWGRRRLEDGLSFNNPAPSATTNLPNITISRSGMMRRDVDVVQVYSTKQEAMAALNARRERAIGLPKPLVMQIKDKEGKFLPHGVDS
ncbi:S-adenosyl-L-methionine-dependent methyltransferase [Serendipita vermifera]|nr:S-adenosyl-L-methionine-dependent methyltransferase [Serendipita vermifera]